MNRLSDQLLACARLTSDENGGVGRGHLAYPDKRTLERRRPADNLLELVLLNIGKFALEGEVEFLQRDVFPAEFLLQDSILREQRFIMLQGLLQRVTIFKLFRNVLGDGS